MKLALPVIVVAAFAFTFSCSSKTETIQVHRDSVSTVTATVSLDPPPPIITYDPADSGTFTGFINLVRSEVELPEWAVAFIAEENVGRFTAKEAYHESFGVILFFVQFVPVGPGVDKLWAVSLTPEGQLVSKVELGESYPSSGPDGGGKDFSFVYDTDRNTVYVTNRTTDWDDEKQEEFTYETLNPFYLDGEGNIVQGRKYPEISERYLEESDLARFSKEDLKIMRNEIFAVYGYIFKTEPMKSYYNALPWYVAERENVDDMLTEIEKANVGLIKAVESSRE